VSCLAKNLSYFSSAWLATVSATIELGSIGSSNHISTDKQAGKAFISLVLVSPRDLRFTDIIISCPYPSLSRNKNRIESKIGL